VQALLGFVVLYLVMPRPSRLRNSNSSTSAAASLPNGAPGKLQGQGSAVELAAGG
jgi:hypothetical protein